MTKLSTSANTTETAPHSRSLGRARIVVATLAAIGFAALAWASFVSPLPRLTYNPSDSVAVGWYRVDPLDHRAGSLPSPLPVNSIVLVPLPDELFLLSVTNPASFDSRYFGPVSASTVIGVAHPVWLETRP